MRKFATFLVLLFMGMTAMASYAQGCGFHSKKSINHNIN